MKQNIKKLLKSISYDEESRFRLITSFKMTMITLFTVFILFSLLFLLLQLDLIFFEAFDISGVSNLKDTFYDFIIGKLSSLLPFLALLFIFINVSAIYVSNLLLRPFKVIGEFCEKRVLDQDASYDPDFFTDLKLLTSFSEFFFSITEGAKASGRLNKVEIPLKYTKIHQPLFEYTFIFHYSLYILISLVAVVGAVYAFASDLKDQILELGVQTLPQTAEIENFLNGQVFILDTIIIIVLVSHVLLHVLLVIHLYQQVSAPAFGIFATMRSFLKGKYINRVHLIGYPYLRPQCRKLNRYLDYINLKYVDMSGEVNK